MNAPGATFPVQKSNSLLAVVWGGLACGVLDITAALSLRLSWGQTARLLQGCRRTAGPRTYSGGIATALLGLLCHFVIAFSAAASTLGKPRHSVSGAARCVLCAAVCIAVYFFMAASCAFRRSKVPLSFKMMIIGIIIHSSA